MYSKSIKEKKFVWGGRALAAPFPSKEVVSIVGSVAGGRRAWGSAEETNVHAEMLLEGTTKRDKKEIQLFLDSIGASLSFTASDERLLFNARVRPVHLEQLLELIAECLTKPLFPKKELAILKKRETASLSLDAQNTYKQAGIAFSRLLFKPQHPAYAETTKESAKILTTITQAKLQTGHKRVLSGATLILAAAGDVKPSYIFKLTQKYFAVVPRKKNTLLRLVKTSASAPQKISVYIPNKASIDYITGLATGITDEHKEYPALMLGIQVLGNRGFASRLMKTVREEEGLTYGIYAYAAGFKKTVDGYLCIWATFAPELFEKGRAATLREIKKIVEEGVTEEEVKKHRELFDARFRVQLSNSGALAQAAHSTVVDGKKLSYLDTFPKYILKLSAPQVNKALKKYLIPDLLSEAAAGPVEKNMFSR